METWKHNEDIYEFSRKMIMKSIRGLLVEFSSVTSFSYAFYERDDGVFEDLVESKL